MHPLLLIQLLALLSVANGAPVIAKDILGARLATPLDRGVVFIDARPLFGASKTLRGVVASVVAASACAPLIGLAWRVGAMVAITAMAGDLISSFLKRRMGLAPSSRAIGLDQIPESLLPLLACRLVLPLSGLDIAVATMAFLVGELALSRVLFRWHIRDRPY